jgi:hypothetical protein
MFKIEISQATKDRIKRMLFHTNFTNNNNFILELKAEILRQSPSSEAELFDELWQKLREASHYTFSSPSQILGCYIGRGYSIQEAIEAVNDLIQVLRPSPPENGIKTDCLYHSGERYLKCAVNPTTPCSECSSYEPKET